MYVLTVNMYPMAGYSTKNWIIGILVGGWVASFVVGYMHGAEMLPEPENPLWHTTRDWIIVMIFVLPISYALARFLPGNRKNKRPSEPMAQFEE